MQHECHHIGDAISYDIKVPAIAEYAACSRIYNRVNRGLCELAMREAPCLFSHFDSQESIFGGADDCDVLYSCFLPQNGNTHFEWLAVGKVYSSAFEHCVEVILDTAELNVRSYSEEAYTELLCAMRNEIQNVRRIFEYQLIPCKCQSFFDELENTGIIDTF